MDPEKVSAWMQTEAGKAFHDQLVQKGIDAGVKEKKLFLPDQVSNMLAEARAEQKTVAEHAHKLTENVAELVAIDSTTPPKAYREQLEKVAAGPLRDAEFGRLKAEAKLLAIKNTQAPTNPANDPNNLKAREAARKGKFDDMAARGRFGAIKDDKERADLYSAFCKSNPL